ncbi:MAG: hypothetical protein WCP85_09525 [Mariniphaga sp.]
MKKLTLLFAILMVTLFATTASATDLAGNSINLKGDSNTQFGKYEVKELAPATVDGELMRTFEVTYEKAQKTVLIYLDERANCKDYIVRSNNLEIRYACKKSSFGTELLTGKHMKYDPNLNSLYLAQDEFARQQKISEGGLPVASALSLIASYYPDLLKRTNLLN